MAEIKDKVDALIRLYRNSSASAHERENASILAQKLCEKYNLDFEKLINTDELEVKWCEFKYRSAMDKEILDLLSSYVIGSPCERALRTRVNKYDKIVSYPLNDIERIKLSELIIDFRRDYKKQLKAFNVGYKWGREQLNIGINILNTATRNENPEAEKSPSDVDAESALRFSAGMKPIELSNLKLEHKQ